MSSPTPHRFNNPIWEFGDILGCLMDPNPTNFGRFVTVDDYRSELRRAQWYKRGKPPLHDENPARTLLHWLQRGDLTAFDKQEDKWLTKKDWVNKDERDVANGVRRYVAERVEALQLIQQKHERQAAGAADSVFDTGLNDPGDPPEEPYRPQPDPIEFVFVGAPLPARNESGDTADGPDREMSAEEAAASDDEDGRAPSQAEAPMLRPTAQLDRSSTNAVNGPDQSASRVEQLADWIFAQYGRGRSFDGLYKEARAGAVGNVPFRKADLIAAYQRVYITARSRPPASGWPLREPYKKRLCERQQGSEKVSK
jgi:hypothetical protein